jgi:hypothetical protein
MELDGFVRGAGVSGGFANLSVISAQERTFR